MYLDAAWGIQPTHNIFVMTDSPDWLQEEMKTIDPSWRIHTLASHGELSRKRKYEYSLELLFQSIYQSIKQTLFIYQSINANLNLMRISLLTHLVN